MSNPLINRWGTNAIWYNFWYSDTNYSKNIQQDRIFSQLLETYLVYGTETNYHHFNNQYWYKLKKNPLPILTYYRTITIKRPLIKMVTSLRLRHALTDYYRMKVWILRYSKWLIINLYWFHPNKKRIKKKIFQHQQTYNFVSVDNSLKSTMYRRLKTLHSLTNFNVLNQVQTSNSFYTF